MTQHLQHLENERDPGSGPAEGAGTPDLAHLFQEHRDYVSDKWEQYIGIYEAELAPHFSGGEPLRLLEIGVQNGGSLQIWSKYLPPGSCIYGIDIDPKCASLRLPSNVQISIGDASNAETLNDRLGTSSFDIIVDDGSHRSDHVIASFENCFYRLRPGGLYFVEDLHCGYFASFGGGLRAEHSSVEYFKKLADALHADHFEDADLGALPADELARLRALNRNLARITFYDSVVVITRLPEGKRRPYARMMTGSQSPVVDPSSALPWLPVRQIRDLMLSPAADRAFSPGLRAGLVAAREELIALRDITDGLRANAFASEARATALQGGLEAERATLEDVRRAWQVQTAELTVRLEEARGAAAAERARLDVASRDERTVREELEALRRDERTVREELEALRRDERTVREELEALRRDERTVREAAFTAEAAAKSERTHKEAETARANIAESRLRFMEQSRAWRAARMLQHISARLPFVRRAARLLWWTVTMQLRRRVRMRREQRELMITIRQTGLFDDTYYLANNPDLAMSGMDLALHYALHGWKEGRMPGSGFDSAFYLARYPDVVASGVNPLLHYVHDGRAEGRAPLPDGIGASFPSPDASAATQNALSVGSTLRNHNAAWAPLPVFADQRSAPTLTILTDSFDPDHLFGGVATAIVVGTFAARRLNARLRLVTRNNVPDPAALGNILQAHQVQWDGPTDFLHMPPGDQKPLSLGDKDLILTTSWWTTRATLGSVNAARILYLLQEDERMFYPFGDLRLRCAETLLEQELRILVNTRQLFDHLADGPDPLPRLRERGHWFQPAFPSFHRPKTMQGPRKGKQNFFFYARPNNDRNLYWRGLEAINAAMRVGVLAADEWNIHFVGHELPEMELPGGVRPSIWARLSWAEYAELVSKMDLGLCLMDTPHPSYPPIDLAASGAVVVTNIHGSKTSLDGWSRNIIAAPPNVAALGDALRDGVKLSCDAAQRFANCAADHIARDWEPELRPVIERLLASQG